MLPDEFAALARAKDYIRMVRDGTFKQNKDKHGKGHNASSHQDEQSMSSTTVDMKNKGGEYDDSFIDSKITTTSTIKMMLDKKNSPVRS